MIGEALFVWPAFIFLFIGIQALGSTTPVFNQTITSTTLSVDIVDADGVTVDSPAVTFDSKNFSFATQDSSGQFGTSSQRIRANNPTATDTWTVNLAASDPTDTWVSGSDEYDFNDAGEYTDDGATTDADSYGGEMTVDPSTGTISGVDSCATTNLSKGTSDSFEEGATDSIDIMSAASGAATACQWDFIGAVANITQKIPASQAVGSYSIAMTVSIQ